MKKELLNVDDEMPSNFEFYKSSGLQKIVLLKWETMKSQSIPFNYTQEEYLRIFKHFMSD